MSPYPRSDIQAALAANPDIRTACGKKRRKNADMSHPQIFWCFCLFSGQLKRPIARCCQESNPAHPARAGGWCLVQGPGSKTPAYAARPAIGRLTMNARAQNWRCAILHTLIGYFTEALGSSPRAPPLSSPIRGKIKRLQRLRQRRINRLPRCKKDLAGREFNERYGARHGTLTQGRVDLTKSCPKTATYRSLRFLKMAA
jgi:hypothetical protein